MNDLAQVASPPTPQSTPQCVCLAHPVCGLRAGCTAGSCTDVSKGNRGGRVAANMFTLQSRICINHRCALFLLTIALSSLSVASTTTKLLVNCLHCLYCIVLLTAKPGGMMPVYIVREG